LGGLGDAVVQRPAKAHRKRANPATAYSPPQLSNKQMQEQGGAWVRKQLSRTPHHDRAATHAEKLAPSDTAQDWGDQFDISLASSVTQFGHMVAKGVMKGTQLLGRAACALTDALPAVGPVGADAAPAPSSLTRLTPAQFKKAVSGNFIVKESKGHKARGGDSMKGTTVLIPDWKHGHQLVHSVISSTLKATMHPGLGDRLIVEDVTVPGIKATEIESAATARHTCFDVPLKNCETLPEPPEAAETIRRYEALGRKAVDLYKRMLNGVPDGPVKRNALAESQTSVDTIGWLGRMSNIIDHMSSHADKVKCAGEFERLVSEIQAFGEQEAPKSYGPREATYLDTWTKATRPDSTQFSVVGMDHTNNLSETILSSDGDFLLLEPTPALRAKTHSLNHDEL
jgi:hypothetical protein